MRKFQSSFHEGSELDKYTHCDEFSSDWTQYIFLYSFNSSLHNILYTPYNLVNSVIVARTIFIKIMSMLLIVVVNKIKR